MKYDRDMTKIMWTESLWTSFLTVLGTAPLITSPIFNVTAYNDVISKGVPPDFVTTVCGMVSELWGVVVEELDWPCRALISTPSSAFGLNWNTDGNIWQRKTSQRSDGFHKSTSTTTVLE